MTNSAKKLREVATEIFLFEKTPGVTGKDIDSFYEQKAKDLLLELPAKDIKYMYCGSDESCFLYGNTDDDEISVICWELLEEHLAEKVGC